MGLYETARRARDMYWLGSTDIPYEAGCDTSPMMPHYENHSPNQVQGSNTVNGDAPLTPLSSSSLTSHHQFVSPGSERSHYGSSISDVESTSVMGSPCPISNQDVTNTSSCMPNLRDNRNCSTPEESFCAGCHSRILDRFVLEVVGKKWHEVCLKCCVCQRLLDNDNTCYTKNSNIFCKDDYRRLLASPRCSMCGHGINESQLFFRAKEYFYHAECFSCHQCNIRLRKGDEFGMHGASIFCRNHYTQMPGTMDTGHISPMGMHNGTYPGHMPQGSHPHMIHGLPPDAIPYPPPQDSISKLQFFNGIGSQHKGRPRKRKPKEEPVDANLNIPNGYEFDGYAASGQPVRSKRVRTSFKHHQLRIMRTYFERNQNPDTKDLNQLSAKTALPKRVLQVWFQNARAKWRRQEVPKDSKGLNSSGESSTNPTEGSTDDGIDYSSSPQGQTPMSPGDSPQHLSFQQLF